MDAASKPVAPLHSGAASPSRTSATSAGVLVCLGEGGVSYGVLVSQQVIYVQIGKCWDLAKGSGGEERGMRGILSRVVLCTMTAILLSTLTGCGESDPRVDMDVEVRGNGTIEQQVRLKGVSLPEESVGALEDAGWKVTNGGSSTTLRGEFDGMTPYGAAVSGAVTVLSDSYAESNGWTPKIDSQYEVSLKTSDFILAKHHLLQVSMPSVDLEPDACPVCDGAGSEPCSDCDGDGIIPCTSCDGDGVWESYWGDSQCSYCDGTGDESCGSCDGDGRSECYSCGGTGEPSEDLVDTVRSNADSVRVEYKATLPGVRQRTEDGDDRLKWSLDGPEAFGGETLTASSWSIRWAAAIPMLLLIAAGLALVMRLSFKRIKGAMPVKAARIASPAPAAPASPGVRFCSACGSQNDASAEFCKGCGTSIKAS